VGLGGHHCWRLQQRLGTSKTSVPGKGVLFVLDPKTGTLLQKIHTSEGSAGSPAGLAHMTGYVLDYGDMTVDYVYAGDLLGNMWRFDFSSATSDVPNPTTPILHLRDSLGKAQPVTTEPRVDRGLIWFVTCLSEQVSSCHQRPEQHAAADLLRSAGMVRRRIPIRRLRVLPTPFRAG
jgi:hypothetical protein